MKERKMASVVRMISFSRRLFFSVLLLFLSFAACFLIYQYQREKMFKIEILNTRLQAYNRQMYETLSESGQIWNDSIMDRYVKLHTYPDLRVTVIRKDGTVLYDTGKDYRSAANHAGRKEVKMALSTGSGYDILRTSSTLSEDFFYSATYFKDGEIIIRSALPYNSAGLMDDLSIDWNYLWFSIALILILAYIYYRYTSNLGKTIDQLRCFAMQAEKDENMDDVHFEFPNNELGEISHHIVRLYTQLRNSEEDKVRLKRQLTQNIAHELKTPVSSIQGYLETIISNPDMDVKQRDSFMERCYAQSNRLASLLRDISLLTRMDEASQSIEMEEVDLYQIVSTVQADVALQLREKEMQFLMLLQPPMKVNGNHSLLYSIFRNLTDNAIAYAGPKVTITVKCIFETDEYYRFSFADNGVGVAPEHLEHLFERFYRIDKGRSRKLGGTGLGLAIVKNSVLFHGGTIFARIAPTGGLEFIFTIKK